MTEKAPDDPYEEFARRVVASTVLSDPWYDGKPRLRAEPIVLPKTELARMYDAAETVAAVYDELTHLVSARPELLESFFAMTPLQRTMWLASEPQWHGIARADLFVLTDGALACAELNCDTPTGEPEAVALNALVHEDHPGLGDPNAGLRDRYLRMTGALAASAGVDARSVGIVYPTEMTEDLALVRLYREWYREAGCEVILGSPYNLSYHAGRLRLFDRPIGVAVRHYKTDWWGERQGAWRDEDVPDTDPLTDALTAALSATVENAAICVNPFGAVLPQNKRAMAFMWEHKDDFSAASQRAIETYIPLTMRMETQHDEQLRAERNDWVLKADYGAEGSEVVIGRAVSEAVWGRSLSLARPGRWVAQRYFEARAREPGAESAGETVNYGVYLVAGEAAGIYARAQHGATDERAVSVPVLVDPAR